MSHENIRPFIYEGLPGRVLFGFDYSRSMLRNEIERLGCERVLLVASKRQSALADTLLEPLGDRWVTTFDNVQSHVPSEIVLEGRTLARDRDADCLLSIGGGSATGMAKAIALETGLPIVCIPTTYAGSEMTAVYGLTEDGIKPPSRCLAVLPKAVIYDPGLTLSLPYTVTGPSAINALAHCVEALYAPGASPIASLMALEGIRAIADGLPDAVLNPSGTLGRAKTLYGAYMAGAALAVAGSGLHHRICHVLGGAYNLPHAETHSIVLPHVAALNREAIPGIMAQIADALGHDDAAEGVFDLARAVGVPLSLRDIGMRQVDLGDAAKRCLDGVPTDNPAAVTEAAMRRLLNDAYEGRKPAHA